MPSFLQNLLLGPLGAYGYTKAKKSIDKSGAESAKINKQVKAGQKLAIKKEEKAYPSYKKGLKELEKALAGKGELKHDIKDLVSKYERAGKGLEPMFQNLQEQAVSNFNQNTRPEIVGKLSAGTAGSSALNQALSAAQGNLQRGVTNDFALLKNQLAQNIVGQSQNAALVNLQNRTNAYNSAIGQPSAYLPPTQNVPTTAQQYGPLLSGVLGGVAGGFAGGFPGAIGGYQAGTSLGQTLFR